MEEYDLRVTTSKRTGGNLGACLNGDVACWQAREPQEKITMSSLFFPLVCNPFTQACNYFHIHCACVVTLVMLIKFCIMLVKASRPLVGFR